MAGSANEEFLAWLERGRQATDRELLGWLAAAIMVVVAADRSGSGSGQLRALVQAAQERAPRSAGASQSDVLGAFKPQAFHYYAQLERLQSWVERHLDEPITLHKAAQVATFEATYFSKFFHQKVGMRFTDWLLWMRIRRAVQLFDRRDLSIVATARRSGFYDVRTFQRAFKKFTGTTPSSYRCQVRRQLAAAAPAAKT